MDVSEIIGAPILVEQQQLRAVFERLNEGDIDGVRQDYDSQKLVEFGEITEGGKKVILWGRADEEGKPIGAPLLAVAVFPDGRLSLAMIGSILFTFNNGQGERINCAFLGNGSQDDDKRAYAKFGANYEARFTGENPDPVMRQAGWSDVILYPTGSEVDLRHVALHLISANHDCSSQPSI